MIMHAKTSFTVFLAMASIVSFCLAADKKDRAAPASAKSGIQQIIFEEQKIEGKIRRPQLVLIKADQRPGFPPMVMQSYGKTENVVDFVDQSAIENLPNQNAFQFEGVKISNLIP
jgi:hypothetical protein